MSAASFAYVAIGGALGATARFALSGWVHAHVTLESRFPYATLLVNVLGCLLAGALVTLLWRYPGWPNEWRVFMLPGVLGGFTTYSAFGLETALFLKRGDWALAASYVGTTTVLGVLAVLLGMALVSQFVPR